MAEAAQQKGERIGMPMASDDAAAVAVASRLVREVGYEAQDRSEGAEALAVARPGARIKREDIRLLGRILGDTLREQEGDAVFEMVENVRRAAVRFRKTRDERDRTRLEDMLDALSTQDTLTVVRAFSWVVTGAENTTELRQFLLESAIIAGVGGLLGVLGGAALVFLCSKLLTAIVTLPPL